MKKAPKTEREVAEKEMRAATKKYDAAVKAQLDASNKANDKLTEARREREAAVDVVRHMNMEAGGAAESQRVKDWRETKAREVAEQRKRSTADPNDLGGDSKLGL
jgi:hypothetical protein